MEIPAAVVLWKGSHGRNRCACETRSCWHDRQACRKGPHDHASPRCWHRRSLGEAALPSGLQSLTLGASLNQTAAEPELQKLPSAQRCRLGSFSRRSQQHPAAPQPELLTAGRSAMHGWQRWLSASAARCSSSAWVLLCLSSAMPACQFYPAASAAPCSS